jgi:hypothetical protein
VDRDVQTSTQDVAKWDVLQRDVHRGHRHAALRID